MVTMSTAQPRDIPHAGAGLAVRLPKPAEPTRKSGLKLDTLSSPVTENGSFEFDRVIKSGEVLKRTRKTKSWKPSYLVLRPNLLSIYRDSSENRLKHNINLSVLTAVARQKDPKRKGKHIFGLFSPSRNFHLEAQSAKEAQEWVELVRREARMDRDEEEIYLASPGGAKSAFLGFGRSIDAIASGQNDGAGYSSSEAEVFQRLPKQRDRGNTNLSAVSGARQTSQFDYSGAEHGSYSDFSDFGGHAGRLSNLSLATDPRPSTSSAPQQPVHSIYGQSYGTRPSLGARSPSQVSVSPGTPQDSNRPRDDERVVYHGYIHLLKSKSGVRQWKKTWMVLRPKALALYKNEEEYTALMIFPFHTIIDVVEIDPISRSKTACMQILSEERNYRFCAPDEESLARWLGAFKSLLSKRRIGGKDGGGAGEGNNAGAVAVQAP